MAVIDLIPVGPLVKQGVITASQNLMLAFSLGIGFGFVLQRSGFTDSRKIAGIFYLRDLDVPVIMFSAIVTGMLGFWGLVALDLIDLSQFYFVPTYILPMVAGGFLMGIGMVTGGYCPGTAAAATVVGRLDAVAVLVGIIIGDLIFANFFDLWKGFFLSSRLEEARIDQFFGIGLGSAMLLVLLFAVAMIVGLRLLKRHFWGYKKKLCRVDRGLFATSLVLGVVFIYGFTHLPEAPATPVPTAEARDNDSQYHIIQIPGWDRGPAADQG
jgi:uncharacterized membrane protein YedE/YeeE